MNISWRKLARLDLKVRSKLFIVMAVLVSFMAGVFFSISHGYLESLFREYAQAAQQATTEQWGRVLAYYYVMNGNSWDGVQLYVANIFSKTTGEDNEPHPEYLVVFDAQNHLVFSVGSGSSASVSPSQLATVPKTPIILNGQHIGSLWIQDSSSQGLLQVEENVLHSMTTATFLGTIITVAVALITGGWLARRMTSPLQQIMKAIKSINDGDMSARVPVQSSDEFGEVATAFNDMTVRLLKTEEARRRLVADVAHELRTPLTIIQGQLELVQEGVKQPDPATLLPIQDEVMRLTRLVQDLHQLSLAEVGKLPLEKQTINLVHLMERIVMNFEIEAEEQQIDIQFQTPISAQQEPVNEVRVNVDPHRITQVFINLLANALKYTPAGGKIVITTSLQASSVRIAVADNGPGIDSEHLPYLFDRFYRADEDRSRGSGGMGLGLALAKELVEAHHGTISVDSTVGMGTTFSVELPLAEK